MKLILARHAQTSENSQKIVQAYGGHLSDIGEQQAKRLSFRLKNEKIDYIYSSDFDRAIKSANEIRSFHPQILLTLDKRLREADFSNYIGVARKDVDWRNIKDIESQESLQLRARDFYNELQKKISPNETVLVMSHAGTIKALTSVILGIHYEKIWDMETPKNCSLSSFRIDGNNIKILTLNDVSHL